MRQNSLRPRLRLRDSPQRACGTASVRVAGAPCPLFGTAPVALPSLRTSHTYGAPGLPSSFAGSGRACALPDRLS